MELGTNSTPSVQPNEVENLVQTGFTLIDVIKKLVLEFKKINLKKT